jgi:hypothetical protein
MFMIANYVALLFAILTCVPNGSKTVNRVLPGLAAGLRSRSARLLVGSADGSSRHPPKCRRCLTNRFRSFTSFASSGERFEQTLRLASHVQHAPACDLLRPVEAEPVASDFEVHRPGASSFSRPNWRWRLAATTTG